LTHAFRRTALRRLTADGHPQHARYDVAVDGLLYVDKPAGITSHDVVAIVRRAARSRRVGHAGTLDPFATGLLVVAVGNCTRLLPYVQGEPKVYDAVVRFGAETDTDDIAGRVTVEASLPDLGGTSGSAALDAAIRSLTGVLAQVPPAYSAKHVDGERAYAIARRGEAVQLAPVTVTVHRWEIQSCTGQRLHARITCAGGTYVRALARDLGRALGSAAHCESLRRVSSGPAHVDRAATLASLGPGSIADGRVPLLSPLDALGPMATEALDTNAERELSQGRAIPATQPGHTVAFVRAVATALTAAPAVLGIGVRIAGERWQPRVVLLGSSA